MKKYISLSFVLLFALLVANSVSAQTYVSSLSSNPADRITEISVNKDGVAKLYGLKVMQRANNTYFCRMYWGDMFIKVTVRSSSKTTLLSRFNEALQVSDVKEGDILNVEGELFPSASEFSVTGSKIINTSYDKSNEQFAGVVASVSMPRTFTLNTSSGLLNVNVSTSTSVSKGSRQNFGSLLLMNTGDAVTSVSGVLDRSKNTLNATNVAIFFDFNLLKAQNFKGVLAENPNLDDKELRVLMSGRVVIVKLDEGALILNYKRKPTLLSRFAKGDSVVFYGAREEADLNTIHVEIVRNLDL